MIEIGPFRPGDRDAWEELARGYKAFYGADRFYWHTQESNARARLLYDQVARFTGFIRYGYPP